MLLQSSGMLDCIDWPIITAISKDHLCVTSSSNTWILSVGKCLEIESGQQLRRLEYCSYNVFSNSVLASVFVAL